MSYIKGTFKRAIYKTDKGYTVGILKISETDNDILKDMESKTITFTGYFCDLNEEDMYILKGELINHPKYGYQYSVNEYKKILPSDEDGIIEFLSSDLFKGVGKAIAKKIVKILGENALNEILENQNCLYRIPKLSEDKMKLIYNTLNKYTESHETIIYLTDMGFTLKDALTIYNKYKDNTIDKVKTNIYDLVEEAEISFNKIDSIAKTLDFDLLDSRRIKALIIYLFNKLIYETGNTYLEYEDIYNTTCKYLNHEFEFDEFNNYLYSLINEKKLYNDDSKYYLYYMYENQKEIVSKIGRLLHNDQIKYKNLDFYIKDLEEKLNINYNDKQIEAIKKALTENLLIITGGPGTGKTTIIKAITSLYQIINNIGAKEVTEEIALLAPTGRASKRMSEATNLPSYTIHRYLKWNKENNSFAINEYNKAMHKLIIVDEVSMIDINLLSSLLAGLNSNVKLILVGDYNQLPSVGPGQILKDLIESNKINTVVLDLLYRQDENSYINILAKEIKDNNLSDNFLKKHNDYNFLECTNLELRETIKALAIKLKEKKYKNIQFLAPMYKGENGIDNLNIILQNIFNPSENNKKEYVYGDVTFRVNDKVLQLENMPDDNVFNGDIGVVKDIYYKEKKIFLDIDFETNVITYEPKDLNKIKHGFIISIHKSQGSEFDNVIIPITSAYNRMLYRKLIYTGITRAKKKLFLVGSKSAFIHSIENNSEMIRKTDLKNKIINTN
ncbi:MAG: ATP-dependent RecD-like DNA helicase [Bacilli bacterium]|nr:ATP-dependent RecD-like DNA helicase [Bacilli bacterium]